jgi:hypothetical protein
MFDEMGDFVSVEREKMLIDRQFGKYFDFLHYLCTLNAKIGNIICASFDAKGNKTFHRNETI